MRWLVTLAVESAPVSNKTSILLPFLPHGNDELPSRHRMTPPCPRGHQQDCTGRWRVPRRAREAFQAPFQCRIIVPSKSRFLSHSRQSCELRQPPASSKSLRTQPAVGLRVRSIECQVERGRCSKHRCSVGAPFHQNHDFYCIRIVRAGTASPIIEKSSNAARRASTQRVVPLRRTAIAREHVRLVFWPFDM